MDARTISDQKTELTQLGLGRAIHGPFPRPVYLDHHATTPVDPRVAKVVLHAMMETFGNPNSIDHVFGEAAAVIIDDARQAVAELVGGEPEHVRFTSGATEAIRIA